MKKILSVTTMCLCLAACGFEPMYGTKMHSTAGEQSINAALSQVEISNIPDRTGQILRNALIDRFYKEGRPANPDYVLDVSPISETTVDLDLTPDSDTTREQLRLNTTMRLVDKASGNVVLERSLRSISSYNVLTSEFATRVSQQNSRENALNDLARQIELQIGLHLRR